MCFSWRVSGLLQHHQRKAYIQQPCWLQRKNIYLYASSLKLIVQGKQHHWDIVMGFPGGSVVKNLPANAGDTGSIPHPLKQLSHVPQLLSLYSRAQEQQLLSPCAATPEARTNALDPPVPQQGEPPQWETPAPQLQSSRCLPKLEKNLCNEDTVQP